MQTGITRSHDASFNPPCNGGLREKAVEPQARWFNVYVELSIAVSTYIFKDNKFSPSGDIAIVTRVR